MSKYTKKYLIENLDDICANQPTLVSKLIEKNIDFNTKIIHPLACKYISTRCLDDMDYCCKYTELYIDDKDLNLFIERVDAIVLHNPKYYHNVLKARPDLYKYFPIIARGFKQFAIEQDTLEHVPYKLLDNEEFMTEWIKQEKQIYITPYKKRYIPFEITRNLSLALASIGNFSYITVKKYDIDVYQTLLESGKLINYPNYARFLTKSRVEDIKENYKSIFEHMKNTLIDIPEYKNYFDE